MNCLPFDVEKSQELNYPMTLCVGVASALGFNVLYCTLTYLIILTHYKPVREYKHLNALEMSAPVLFLLSANCPARLWNRETFLPSLLYVCRAKHTIFPGINILKDNYYSTSQLCQPLK